MTKFVLKTCLFCILWGTLLAQAQTYKEPPHFNHIVIIVQENRTPDDVFGAGPGGTRPRCGQEVRFEAGVDITNGGPNLASKEHHKSYITCLTPLKNMVDGGANHEHIPDWTHQFDHGAMDGACLNTKWRQSGHCPEYTYVNKQLVQPYFDIATNYGFANYMFQTNQGPSLPAHQFIFGGTSAPVLPGNSKQEYYKYFVAENAEVADSGCLRGHTRFPNWIDPAGDEHPTPLYRQCYDYNTLVTFQDDNGVIHDKTNKIPGGWKYYAQKPGIVWDAPQANYQTCYFAKRGNGDCNSKEFTDHVSFAESGLMKSAPIFSDIQKCQLAAISWVTPDEAWSDHPGPHDKSLGPSWVADIVNAIGNSGLNSHGQCDYWEADPTAIFILWDDWGGFYDHVPPPVTYLGSKVDGKWECSAPNGWGCGYVYGFRVPLLVVSRHTPPGTVSGAIVDNPIYPPPREWTHDFGSILAFVEHNFELPPIAPSGYTYADVNSLDRVYQGKEVIPLWEFFLGTGRKFTQIPAPHSAEFFMNYYATPQADGTLPMPEGPDGGDDD